MHLAEKTLLMQPLTFRGDYPLLGNFGSKEDEMSGAKFTDEFKRDAVAQVVDRGYPVREVAERLGVSTKSIYTWQKQFSRPAKVTQEVDAQAS